MRTLLSTHGRHNYRLHRMSGGKLTPLQWLNSLYKQHKPMIKPTKDNILIERTESLKQIGSIHLPDVALDSPTKFKVLAVSSAITEVKVGDNVYALPYKGKKINDIQRIVKLDDILFVYNENEKAI